MTPADQGLETSEAHVAQTGDRLVDDFDLVALDGAAQVLLEGQELGAVVAHVGRKNSVESLPRRLAS